MSTAKRGRPAGSQVMPTDNDWRVLQVILRHILANLCEAGIDPFNIPDEQEVSCTLGLTDIGNATGAHSLVVRDHVRRLEVRGVLRRERKPGSSPTTFFMPWRMARALVYVQTVSLALILPGPLEDTFPAEENESGPHLDESRCGPRKGNRDYYGRRRL